MIIYGEKDFIPEHTEFTTIITMADKGSPVAIRRVDKLVITYGGKASEWKKQAGNITSKKYIFDLHWYELNGIQYEVKIKNR